MLMAKTKKPAKKIGGPFIAAAVFCNSITEDSDGVLSANRIIDEIQAAVRPDAPADFPSKKMPIDLTLFGLISIRRGDASSGKHKLRLVMEQPDGKTSELSKQDVEMPPHPNGAVNVRVKMALKLFSAGTFWIDVILDGKRLTRMVLNLVLLRMPPATNPSAS
jgi:hypothetical protein